MQITEGLVFDLLGDYAHFRKAEATTSPLTYAIPPGTVLAGFIGSILGLERDSYYTQFSRENLRFAMRVVSPIRKIRVNRTIIRTSEPPFYSLEKKNPRSRIPYQYLKNPHYRAYVWFSEENLYSKLKRYLKSHKTVYTPYLGISELIANYKFLGQFTAKKKEVREADGKEIHSIVKRKNNVIVKEERTYLTETIPLYMKKKRIVEEFKEVLFEKEGKPILLTEGDFHEVTYEGKKERVIFL